MDRFTEEEIQLANKYEVMFYTINRELQSKTEIFLPIILAKMKKFC